MRSVPICFGLFTRPHIISFHACMCRERVIEREKMKDGTKSECFVSKTRTEKVPEREKDGEK